MASGIGCPPVPGGRSSGPGATRAATVCRPDAAPVGAVSPTSPSRVGRVRGRRRFAALHATGSRRRSGPIMTTVLLDDAVDRPLVAYAIPRTAGPAVTRNRLRRRLRALVRRAHPPRPGRLPPMTSFAAAPPAVSPGARPLMALVRLYQRARVGRPSPCRFDPSCSTYALEALEHHGAVKGLWLAARRLSRCHPWGGQGWDPVPPNPHAKVENTCS